MDKKFEHYLHETRGEFVKAVNELQWNTEFRTKCENLLIAFDQMKQALSQQPASEQSEQLPCERCKKMEFMIDNGLGWKDMENDCT